MTTIRFTAAVAGLVFAGVMSQSAHAQYQNGCGPNACPNGNLGVQSYGVNTYNSAGLTPHWGTTGQNYHWNQPQFQGQTQVRNRYDVPQHQQVGNFRHPGVNGSQYNGYDNNLRNSNTWNHDRFQPQYPVQRDHRFNPQPMQYTPANSQTKPLGLMNWSLPKLGSGLF